MKFQLNSQDVRFGFGVSSNAVVKFPGLGIPTAPVGAAAVGDYSDTTLGNVGTPGDFGYDSPAVSRWDVIPMQEVVEYPYIGLVAFHVNNIDKVEFSLNGGTWTEVTEMKENPSSGVYEYCVKVDTTSLNADDEIELRAKITPLTAGQVYGIDPITVKYNYSSELIGWVSPSGSDSTGDATEGNPCRTPLKALNVLLAGSVYTDPEFSEKVTIYCTAGEHVIADNSYGYNPAMSDGWVTIQSAPGVAASSVIFRDTIDSGTITGRGWRVRNTRLKGVTFEGQIYPRTPVGESVPNVWIDGVTYSRTEAVDDVWLQASWTDRYATSCAFENLNDGPKFCTVLRNSTLNNYTEDAVGYSRLVANCVVTQNTFSLASAHPDFLHVQDCDEHSIFYNVVGLDINGQGIYSGSETDFAENMAFVNCLAVLESGAAVTSAPASQIRNTDVTTMAIRNVIIDSCTILNGQSFILDEGASPTGPSRDVVLRNSIIYGPSSNLGAGVLTESNNWYIDTDGNFTCVGGTFSTTTATYSSVADLVPTEAGIVGQAVRPDIKTDARGILRTTNNIGALG